MARGLRLTKLEREVVKFALEDWSPKKAAWIKARESINAKLEESELPVKRSSYLTVDDAIAAFRGVLGPRLIAPLPAAAGVKAQMKNRIQALGLTRADCESVARVAGVQWDGQIRAESLVRQADKLMAEAQLELPTAPRKPGTAPAPVELDDDDI